MVNAVDSFLYGIKGYSEVLHCVENAFFDVESTES